MKTLSWRRAGASSALALATVTGLPAIAQAQLFPNMWIQRERNACALEPPFYKHVRQDYYGYYPTCWRRFPEGWACPCPNPELPDANASFARIKRDPKPVGTPDDEMDLDSPATGGAAPGAGTGTGGGADRGGRQDNPDLPALPADRTGSPFSGIDSRRTPSAPPAATPGPDAPARPANPGSRPSADPFDPIAPALPRSNGPGSTGYKPPKDGPDLEQPADASAVASTPTADTLGESGDPVLALPEMAKPSGSLPAEAPAVAAMPPSLPPSGTTVEPQPVADPPAAETVTETETTTPTTNAPPAPAPSQAKRRAGLLGGLFNNLGNWRRR